MSLNCSIKELVWTTIFVDSFASTWLSVIYTFYMDMPSSVNECIILDKPYGLSIMFLFVYMMLIISTIILLFISINNIIEDIINKCKGESSRIISNIIVTILLALLIILLIYACFYNLIEPCGIMLQVNSIVGPIVIFTLCLFLVLFTLYMIRIIKDTFNKEFKITKVSPTKVD